MFAVEIHIQNEDSLADAMTGMRQWLDHRRLEPSMFRYTFITPGILMHVDFAVEGEATNFAEAFGGKLVSLSVAPAPARQFIDSAAKG